MSKTRVVNINVESCDVLVCRPSAWGNPYTHIKDKKTKAKFVVSTRKEAVEKYREWILSQPELMNRLHELKGKKLGCVCAPKMCHADILVELIESIDYNSHSLF